MYRFFRGNPRLTVCSVAQSCLTLCSLMNCSLPGSSVHGIFQARILEWVAMFYFRGSYQPRDRTRVFSFSILASRFFTTSVTWEASLDLTDEKYFSSSSQSNRRHRKVSGFSQPRMGTWESLSSFIRRIDFQLWNSGTSLYYSFIVKTYSSLSPFWFP